MYNLFTQEELDYLKANSAWKTLKEMTEGINQLPGRKRTEKSVRMKLWRLGLTYRYKNNRIVDTQNVITHQKNEGLHQVTSWLKTKGKPEIEEWLAEENKRIPNSMIIQGARGKQALFRERKSA